MLEVKMKNGTKRSFSTIKETAKELGTTSYAISKALRTSDGAMPDDVKIKVIPDEEPTIIAFMSEGGNRLFRTLEEAVKVTHISSLKIKALINNGEELRGYTFDYLYE